MARKTKIATKDEILQTLTDIMRSSPDDGVKVTEMISAAEKLYKYLKEEDTDRQQQYGVVILPEVQQE